MPRDPARPMRPILPLRTFSFNPVLNVLLYFFLNFPRLNPSSQGFIIVFNHISMVDSPLIVTLFMPSVLAKEDVLHYPIIGPFLRSLDMLYVKRESANSGGLAAQIKVRATDKRYNGPLAIAPEGTCSNGKCLLR